MQINRFFHSKCLVIFAILLALFFYFVFYKINYESKRGSFSNNLNSNLINLKLSVASKKSKKHSIEKIEPKEIKEELPESKKSPIKKAKKIKKVQKITKKENSKEDTKQTQNQVNSIENSTNISEANNSLGDESSKSNMINYQSLIKGILNKYKKYPKKALMLHKSGKVKINAKLDENGKLIAFKIVQKDRFESFNKEVIKLFQKITTFPKPPKDILENGIFSFSMFIVFNLKD